MRTVAKTEAIERRVTELETLLRSSLARHPRISFDSLRITTGGPPLDLGALAKSDTGTTGGGIRAKAAERAGTGTRRRSYFDLCS